MLENMQPYWENIRDLPGFDAHPSNGDAQGGISEKLNTQSPKRALDVEFRGLFLP